MKFTKMQGLGNDYVYVNCFKEKIENPSELAVKISDRHFGVGSDGLIMINPSDKADFEMEMYNHRTRLILRWRCTMQTVHAVRCAETGSAVWQNMSTITD